MTAAFGAVPACGRQLPCLGSAHLCCPVPTCLQGWPVPGEAWAPARLARGGGRGTGSEAAGLRR